MTQGPRAVPKVRTDLVFRPLDEEWVVYDPSGEKLHVLNRTAAVVYMHCTGELTVDQIVEAVGEAFEGRVERDQLETDVEKVLGEFAEKGVLE